jgi:hypothetical protein
MKYISLCWPIVLLVTVGLYVLVLLTLPFSALYSTIFLLTLIAFWSRLPGVGIQHPFYILYQMDVIDIFMILIAVNVGPMQAIAFIWFCNMVSRSAGVYPDWAGVIQDCILLSITALAAPLLNMIVGGNLLAVVTIYSIFRPIGFFLFNFIWPRMSWPQRIMTSIIAGGELFLINAFYVKLFGNFFNDLLMGGMVFSWPLFIFATIVIFIVYVALYGIDSLAPKKGTAKNIAKMIVKTIKKEEPRKDTDQQDMNFVRDALK